MRIGSPQNSFGMFRADAPFSRLLRRECLQLARTKSIFCGRAHVGGCRCECPFKGARHAISQLPDTKKRNCCSSEEDMSLRARALLAERTLLPLLYNELHDWLGPPFSLPAKYSHQE